MSSATSIRSRLLSLSKNEKLTFQQIAFRYFHERFLARLALSQYRDNLLLKGGSFIYASQGNAARPTIDIDFLGSKIRNDVESIKEIIKSICKIPLDDCVTFNPDTILATIIAEQKEYHGTRLIVDISFDTMKEKVQLDIGFGDKVTPRPMLIEYPVLLPEFQRPQVLAYTIETAMAEKLHAIYTLAGFNSRVKDYYDLYMFMMQNEWNKGLLQDALKNTFEARNTPYNKQGLIEIVIDYSQHSNNIKMWNVFLKRIKAAPIEFNQVAIRIQHALTDN